MSAITSTDEFIDHTTAMALEERAKLKKHFTPLRHLLLPDLHDRRRRHARCRLRPRARRASPGSSSWRSPSSCRTRCRAPSSAPRSPSEGGCYVWTRLAFGSLVAAVNAVFYWFIEPDVDRRPRSSLPRSTTVRQVLLDRRNSGFYLVGLAYIWFSVYSAILSFGIGKWIPTLGAWARIFAARPVRDQRRSSTRSRTASACRRSASSSRPTRCSSRSCRCCSSTTSASSSRARQATR